MSANAFLNFTIVCSIFSLVPGMGTAFVISNANKSFYHRIAGISGLQTSIFIYIIIAISGLHSLITKSDIVIVSLQYIGAGYFFIMGILKFFKKNNTIKVNIKKNWIFKFIHTRANYQYF